MDAIIHILWKHMWISTIYPQGYVHHLFIIILTTI